LFEEFGHLKPSKSILGRLSTHLGETWDSAHEQLEPIFSQAIEIPEEAVTVSASLDGIMIPLNKKIENGYQAPKLIDAEKKEHESKKDKAYYREASCAAIN
jgi:hypothetical protein